MTKDTFEDTSTLSCSVTTSSLPSDSHVISKVDNDLLEIVILADPVDTATRSVSNIDIHASESPLELRVIRFSNHNQTSDRLSNLPPEIIQYIIYVAAVSDFNHEVLLKLMRVSKLFRNLTTSDTLWCLLFEDKFPTKLPYPHFRPQVFATWRECYAYEYQRARGIHCVLAHQKLTGNLISLIMIIGCISPVILFGLAHTYWIYPIAKYFLEAFETPIYVMTLSTLGYQEQIFEEPDRFPSWNGFWKYIWATKTFRVAVVLQVVMLFIAMLTSINAIHSEAAIEVVSDILFAFPLVFWVILFYSIFNHIRSSRRNRR